MWALAKLESEQPPNSAHTASHDCARELASFHTSRFAVDELVEVADAVMEVVDDIDEEAVAVAVGGAVAEEEPVDADVLVAVAVPGPVAVAVGGAVAEEEPEDVPVAVLEREA